MSRFIEYYDSRSGKKRNSKSNQSGGSIGMPLSKRIGTNLGGTKPWRNGFVGPNSGIFTWSGDDSEFWQEVLKWLAHDCVLGMSCSLSMFNNPECQGILMTADVDAEVCELWRPGQCLQLALTILEAYTEMCPALKEGERRPLFVYSEPSETKCKRVTCCKKCGYADLSYEDGEVKCQHCSDEKTELIFRSSYKVGCHLNGIQHRLVDDATLDSSKSGAILTTEQHLFVRNVAISLWSKYSSEKPTLCFKTGLEQKEPVQVRFRKDEIVWFGMLDASNDGTATITLESAKESELVNGVYTIECGPEEFKGDHAMIAYVPRDVPPFPGGDAADQIIDAAIYGSSGSWNGCLRPPWVPKVNQNCTCSNVELGIRECFYCGGSVSRGQSFKVENDERMYIPKAFLYSDGTVEPIHQRPDRFIWEIESSDTGYHINQKLTGKIVHFLDDSTIMDDISLTISEIDERGRIVRVTCDTGIHHLEYRFPKLFDKRHIVGVMTTGSCTKFKIVDDRWREMKSILRKTCNFLPRGTQCTEMKANPEFSYIPFQALSEPETFRQCCDESMGIVLPKQKASRKRKDSHHQHLAPIYSSVQSTPQQKVHKMNEKIRNPQDPRYKKLKEILLRYWGEKNGGFYNSKTTFTITICKNDPEWARTTSGKTRSAREISLSEMPVYLLKVQNDSRCCNAMRCPHHPHLYRKPPRVVPMEPQKRYCTNPKCMKLKYGVHNQTSPCYMRVDVDFQKSGKKVTPIPKVTMACFSTKLGYKNIICSNKLESEKRVKEGRSKMRKFETGIHPWYELSQEDNQVLYSNIFGTNKRSKVGSRDEAQLKDEEAISSSSHSMRMQLLNDL